MSNRLRCVFSKQYSNSAYVYCAYVMVCRLVDVIHILMFIMCLLMFYNVLH